MKYFTKEYRNTLQNVGLVEGYEILENENIDIDFLYKLNCKNYCDTSPNKFNSFIKRSNGVSNSRHFLGLEFIL